MTTLRERGPVRNQRGSFCAAGLLSLALLLTTPALAEEPYYFVVDVPTDLGSQTYLPWNIVRNDAGTYSVPVSLPAGTRVNALNFFSAADVLFSVAAPTELGGTLFETRDVIRFDGVDYTMYFDGSAEGLPASATIDSILIAEGDLVLGFDSVTTLATQTFDRADLVRVTPGTFNLFLDASGTTPPIPTSSNVTGADRLNDTTLLTFDVPTSLGPFTYLPGELVAWDGSGFSSYHLEPAWPDGSRIRGLSLDPAMCVDGDGDGYGDPGSPACSGGAATDCNDADASINPGAAEVGCDGIDNDCDAGTEDILDADSDRYGCDTDCNDNDPEVNPNAPEAGCDGIDNDCNPATPDVLDADQDTFACDVDCDDDNAAINPGAAEVGCDGIDNDCNHLTLDNFDGDGDTYRCEVDCDDADASVNPGADEVLCDAVDNDCDPGTPDAGDADGDTYACDVDCNDADAAINPGAAETACDGVDNDCNAATPDVVDGDSDTYGCDVDCDDADAAVNPGAAEAGCDAVDNDCNPATPDVLDADGDSFACDTDCDDDDADINPGAAEVGCDGIDNDCDGGTSDVLDADADSFACDTDCDDGNADVNPGAAEVGCDGIDNDCDGGTPDLADGDGDSFACDVDCDDAEPAVNPGAAEIGCDGIDNDCSPATDDVRDGDEDGRACDTDCDDQNGEAWAAPGEALQVLPAGGVHTFVWSPPAAPGTSPGELTYDVIRSSDAADFGAAATCVVSDAGPAAEVDDPATPPTDTLFFYLVRARNACPDGAGPLGLRSDGSPRSARTCP